MSLLGAEWVLYLLVLLSVLSISLIFDRVLFYRNAQIGLEDFRSRLRKAVASGQWDEADRIAETRFKALKADRADLETEMAYELLRHARSQGKAGTKPSSDVLSELARDSVFRARLSWDRGLSVLATIGTNAPFVGLFGTVLGIIKAFHDLTRQDAGAGIQGVSSGISEALVATAIGILVAIPAVVAYNLFQRRVKTAMSEVEALKSYLIGKLAE